MEQNRVSRSCDAMCVDVDWCRMLVGRIGSLLPTLPGEFPPGDNAGA